MQYCCQYKAPAFLHLPSSIVLTTSVFSESHPTDQGRQLNYFDLNGPTKSTTHPSIHLSTHPHSVAKSITFKCLNPSKQERRD